MSGGRPWWADAVVYQLYVRSFADSDGDGIGDLPGITARLDHLAGLGVDAIWLNPCFPSPQRDHGYDVSDYFDIEPDYGTLGDFDELVAEAGARGIRILMDVVPNHCSDQHAWFQAALAAGPGSAERERFWFRNGRGDDGAQPPNNWRAIFGGSAWNRVVEPDGSPGQWYLAVFTPYQPDFNWNHPDVAEHFDEMLRFWFDRGVEGFRADAVTVVGKDPALPDVVERSARASALSVFNPHYTYRPEGHVAWRRWRQVVDRYRDEHPGRDPFLVAEAYTPKRPELAARFANSEQFHQSFAFDLMLAPWNAATITEAIRTTLTACAASDAVPAWTLNNHDMERSATRYGRANAHDPASYTGSNLIGSAAPVSIEVGWRRTRAAFVLMLGLPGTAYLYMGEELGLPEVLDLAPEARQDPIFHRTAGQVAGRDGCRVPMPWTADPDGNHGFGPAGSAASWLPQPADWSAWAADAQAGDPRSMLELYRAALACRRGVGPSDTTVLEPHDQLVIVDRGAITVICNPGSEPVEVPRSLGARTVLLSSSPDARESTIVPPDTTVWLSPTTGAP